MLPLPEDNNNNSTFADKLKTVFVTGFLITLPSIITFLLLSFLFKTFDNILNPLIEKIFKIKVPGLGFIATIVLVFLVGLLATNLKGRKVLDFGEGILMRLPLVKGVYSGSKKMTEAFSHPGHGAFHKVALVQYPHPGTYAVGFVTTDVPPTFGKPSGKHMVNIFVPTTPNPTSGFLLCVPEEDLIPLPYSVEEALKYIVSGGVLVPPGKEMESSKV